MMKDKQSLIEQTRNYVQKTLDNDGSHDWWHVYRVWNIASHIAKSEADADLFMLATNKDVRFYSK